MEIDGKITMLFGEDGLRIEVQDETSSLTFIRIKLNAEQTCQVMSRLANTPCEKVEVYGLDKINKKMEHKQFEFEIPNDLNYKNRKERCCEIVKGICPKGWEPDYYFESQTSFFSKNDKDYARCIIRKWS